MFAGRSSSPSFVTAVASAALVALAGCSGSDDDAPDGPALACEGAADVEACFTSHYFPHGAELASRCSGATPPRIDARREVAFFKGAATDAALVSYGQGLQAFYEPYGLTFFTRQAPASPSLTYAINGTNQELEDLERELDPSTPAAEREAEIERRVNEILFGPLRAFVAAQSNPPSERVNIVVLGQVTSPEVAKMMGSVLGGIGLSPRLFRDVADDDPQRNLFELMGLPDDFTPALFLGHADIAKYDANKSFLVAHEMGHALGLRHTSISTNVMTNGAFPAGCTPTLDDGQIAQLRQGLTEEDIHATRESWEELFELRAKVLERFARVR